MYAGQNWYDPAAAQGVLSRKRNPKRKNRLPYHAKKNVGPLFIIGKVGSCPNSVAQHEEINLGGPNRFGTISYAVPCLATHKKATKVPQHRDVFGRKWK